MPETAPLSGSVALVTGASRERGIGAAIARALAGAGADIFITYFHAYDETMPWGSDPDAPDELLQELRDSGVRAAGLAADLNDPGTIPPLFDAVESTLGSVTILINNATYSIRGDIAALTADHLDRHYAVNVRAMALLCAEYARRFPDGEAGRIVNLSSGQGLGPMPDELAYAATKGAVEAFTTSLSAGLAPRGITVNALDPGPTDTGWMTDDLRRVLTGRAPLGRVGTPEDAAQVVRFLVSPAGGWITGQVIHARGGL